MGFPLGISASREKLTTIMQNLVAGGQTGFIMICKWRIRIKRACDKSYVNALELFLSVRCRWYTNVCPY